jgi:hypothetical protein
MCPEKVIYSKASTVSLDPHGKLPPRMSWTNLGDPDCISRGLVLSHGVRTHCRCLGVYHFLWTRGGPRPTRVVGSSAVTDPE